MPASLLPHSCTSRSLLVVTRLQLKSLNLGRRRTLQGGRTTPSMAGAAAAANLSTAVKSYEDIPGPKPLPIIGNMWRFFPVVGEYAGVELDDLYRGLHEKYGPIVRLGGIPGRRDSVFSYRPEDLEVIYRNEGHWPFREILQTLGYYRTVVRKDFYQDGGSVVTENGPKWLESRSKVNQPMMHSGISKMYTPQVNNVAQEFIDKMRTMRDEKNELPPHFINELFKWALESIACVALDTRLGCLDSNPATDAETEVLIHAVNIVFESFFRLEFGLHLWRVFPTPAWKKLVNALDTFLEVSVKYVQAAMDRVEKRKMEGQDGEWEPSVLERLVAKGDSKTATIMAQDMMLAGIDTTSYSIAMALYMLSKNQDKQEMLFQEVKRLLPQKDSPITVEIHEEMKFLKAVIKECMRMTPIVVGGTRTTVKEIVLSNYKVPEGVNVIMPNVIYRNNENIYPLAKRFIPERWLKARPSGDAAGSAEDFDAVTRFKGHPFAYLPFGFGPRSCVGKRFAEMEMEILLAKIVRNFHVEYHYGEAKISSRLINMIKDPLTFKLTDRND